MRRGGTTTNRIIKPIKRPCRIGKLEFQDPVLLSALLYLLLMQDNSGFLRISLLASAGHELGHIVVYCLFYGGLPRIRVSATGLTMKTGEMLQTPCKKTVLALAGPAANFLLAGVALGCLNRQFTLRGAAFLSANILLGLFNLVPIPPLDGAVILQFLVQTWREKLHFLRK